MTGAGERARRAPFRLLPSVLAAGGLLLWWSRSRRAGVRAARRAALRETDLNEAEQGALATERSRPIAVAALASDVALADRYERYAG